MKWFYDKYYPGYGICLEIKKKIFSKKSKYQKIEIFETKKFGRMLVLDEGFGQYKESIQLTERDEFIYHEMIVHVPLFSLPGAPVKGAASNGASKKVLIIGDGDGGILREVLKHPVKEVYIVEIDEEVIKACAKFLPSVGGKSLKDKRVKLIIGNGARFIKDFNNFFDLVIVGAPDPSGSGKILFSLNFYKNIYRALAPWGMMISQSGPVIFWPETEYGQIRGRLKKVFPKTATCLAFIPTYPGALWSFAIGSKKIDPAKMGLENLKRKYKQLKIKTKYYNPEIHLSSYVLPNFLKKYER